MIIRFKPVSDAQVFPSAQLLSFGGFQFGGSTVGSPIRTLGLGGCIGLLLGVAALGLVEPDTSGGVALVLGLFIVVGVVVGEVYRNVSKWIRYRSREKKQQRKRCQRGGDDQT